MKTYLRFLNFAFGFIVLSALHTVPLLWLDKLTDNHLWNNGYKFAFYASYGVTILYCLIILFTVLGALAWIDGKIDKLLKDSK